MVRRRACNYRCTARVTTLCNAGLKDIARQLGSETYSRLRVGVGRPGMRGGGVSDHVLSAWAADERAVRRAATSLRLVVRRYVSALVETHALPSVTHTGAVLVSAAQVIGDLTAAVAERVLWCAWPCIGLAVAID